MAASRIEWTDVTDNIIVAEQGGWWCRHASPGCDHCYAEKLNQNAFFGGNKLPYRGAPPPLKLREDVIDRWTRQRKSKRHFVASMTDTFGDWVPRAWIHRYLDGMLAAPRQTFQLLTKRADVMRREVLVWLALRGLDAVPAHIWLGVTVENQEWANRRRADFAAIPALVKFVSYEPALGTVDWSGWEFVQQIISGGESGDAARPSHPDWHRGARDFCLAHGIAYLFKQWGGWKSISEMSEAEYDLLYRSNRRAKEDEDQSALDDVYGRRCVVPNDAIAFDGSRGSYPVIDGHSSYLSFNVGKKAAGRLLDGRTWDEIPATGGSVC